MGAVNNPITFPRSPGDRKRTPRFPGAKTQSAYFVSFFCSSIIVGTRVHSLHQHSQDIMIFQAVHHALLIALTSTAITCTVERSFSTLRQGKLGFARPWLINVFWDCVS